MAIEAKPSAEFVRQVTPAAVDVPRYTEADVVAFVLADRKRIARIVGDRADTHDGQVAGVLRAVEGQIEYDSSSPFSHLPTLASLWGKYPELGVTDAPRPEPDQLESYRQALAEGAEPDDTSAPGKA